MAGKIYVFLVGLGVFLMLAAGGYGVKLLLSDRTPATEDDISIDGTTTPTTTASQTVAGTTPVPTPGTTTPRPTTTTPKPTPTLPLWHQVYSDDFNDLAGWTATNDVSGSDVSCLRYANATISGGMLILKAQAEQVTCGNGDMRAYTTASVESNTPFGYAAFEVRARGPIGSALGLAANSWIGGIGLGVNNADWHTYRTEWEPGVIRQFVDGYQTSSQATSAVPGAGLTIHLALAVSAPDATTTLPAEFQIDYVRVYSR